MTRAPATTLHVLGRKMWVAGRSLGGAAWQIIGVFDDERRAVAECKTGDDFVAPVTVNHRLPEGAWPGSYRPKHDMPSVT